MRMNGYHKFGIGSLAVLAVFLWLGLGGIKYVLPDSSSGHILFRIPELESTGAKARGVVAVIGFVKAGSITSRGKTTSFLLVERPGDSDTGEELKVAYDGDDLPDTFGDRAQALTFGRMGSDRLFHATRVQAKSVRW